MNKEKIEEALKMLQEAVLDKDEVKNEEWKEGFE